MSLYSLTADWQTLYNMMGDEDAEENADLIFDTIEGIEGEIEQKADGYAKVIAQITADMEAKEKEIDRLLSSFKRDERNIKRLKDSLMGAMKVTGKTKFKTALFSFSVAKNGGKAPLVYAEGVTPDLLATDEKDKAWTKSETKYKFDTDKIRKALEEGAELPFVKIGERGESLRIK